MPAILVECGFMSTKDDLNKLIDPHYQALLGTSIANGIEDYFNLKPIKKG